MATVHSLICWGGRTGKTVSLSASTDVVTLTNHGLRHGTKLWPSGTLPAELSVLVPVYARSTAANTFTLHTSAAGAIANTGQILFAGSSAYAAIVLKSDLIASVGHSALAPYGLSDLSRWGSSGAERIYDGLINWRAARYPIALPNDSEYCEIGDAFDEYISSTLSLNIPSAETIIHSKINGVVSSAWHNNSFSSGFLIKGNAGYSWNIGLSGFRTTLDGVRYESSAATYVYGINIGGAFNAVKNCLLRHVLGSSTTGINNSGYASIIENNVIIGFNDYGIGLQEYAGQASTISNNTVVKCGTGFKCVGTANTQYGWVYNNVSVGNTTNWSAGSTNFYGAGFNGGAPTDTPWFKGTDTGIKTLAADNSTFVDYAGNDLRPAGDSVAHTSASTLVDSGRTPVGVDEVDIFGNARPDYKNGSATAWDIGAFEFDWGYVIPVSTTVTFSGVNAGSEIRVYNTALDELVGIETCVANQSLTWAIPVGNVRIVIIHPDYKIKEFTYASVVGNQSLPVQQERDKWYKNPV